MIDVHDALEDDSQLTRELIPGEIALVPFGPTTVDLKGQILSHEVTAVAAGKLLDH